MKIAVKYIDKEGRAVSQVIETDGKLELDLDPDSGGGQRVGPGANNGFMSPDALIQLFHNGPAGQVVGIKIFPEPGRSMEIPEFPSKPVVN
jgi:hypothetical protein